jgi:hypothetical protein
MSDTLELEAPTVVKDSFDGIEKPLEDRTPREQIVEKKEEPVIVEKKEEPIVVEKKEGDIIIEDGRNFLKEKLGYDDWDSVKAEIETLKTKAQTPAEFKLESLETGKIKEIYAVIEKKEKLDQLTTGDVTKENAPAIIKAAMVEKYKGLSPEMINHKFNKSWAIPPKPKEDSFVDTDEFTAAQNDWKEKVADIEMEMLIEANVVRPELEKIKSEIKLPEIPKTEASYSQTPEELAKEKADAEQFLLQAGEAIKKFEGFNVAYKNKDVDVQSNYALSDEEKASVMGKMKLLAEKSYNSNAIFAERWVNADLSFNYAQIAKDLATLETSDKSSQKFVSDTAAKVKEQFLRNKHNTDLGKQAGGDLQLEDKTTKQKNEDAIWN